MTSVNVNIRMGNNRAIMTSKNTNINDLFHALEYKPDGCIKSMYRLRFRMIEPEIKLIIEGLDRFALNITINIAGRKLVLTGYRIFNHSYAVVNKTTPFYDVWIVPADQA